MNKFVYQRGVGLVEVLVAVLLLSIAVLGFSALQMRAIGATDESLARTKSLNVVRNLSEIMRAYPEAYVTGTGSSFTSAKPDDVGALPTIQAVISSEAIETVTLSHRKTKPDGTVEVISETIDQSSCLSTETKTVDSKKVPQKSCTINQLAARDALMIKKIAADEDIKVTIVTCPGMTADVFQQQMCAITAWNDTKALLDDDDTLACANANGIYKTGSNCLISEAY